MVHIRFEQKQKRVRCSDEDFLKAVFSSKTYAEIAEKTGQKVPSTMARYARIKGQLAKRGETLPKMERAKNKRNTNNLDMMADMVRKLRKLKEHHTGEG